MSKEIKRIKKKTEKWKKQRIFDQLDGHRPVIYNAVFKTLFLIFIQNNRFHDLHGDPKSRPDPSSMSIC